MKILFLLFILYSCSTPQLIRSHNYYHSDWSIAAIILNPDKIRENQENHPIFYDTEGYKGGEPAIVRKLDYFVFGNFPNRYVLDISTICGNKKFKQAYINHELGQAFISVLTLGIYTPRTAKVWCNEII